MSERKIIAVVGATGAQGGGLVRAILADPDSGFAVRALTRDPDSDRARELAAAGAEVVAADLDAEGLLADAFDGAYAAYLVTNFWEHFSPEKEREQAYNMARAARAAGLRHCIWSTLEDTRQLVPLEDDRMPTLMERYKVPHFDAKGEANAIFDDFGVPTTFLYTSFYWDNFIHFGSGPQRGEDGSLALVLPMGDARLPGIAAEDIGRCAFGILREGTDNVGRFVGIAGEHLTGHEMAAAMGAALGEPVTYVPVDPATYRSFDFPGADDLGNMFQYKHDFNEAFCARRDVARSRELNPRLQSFAQWLERHAGEIPID